MLAGGLSGESWAGSCSVSPRTFPANGGVDVRTLECGNARARVAAQQSGGIKYVSALFEQGTVSANAFGLDSSGAVISACHAIDLAPPNGKRDISPAGACAQAVKWSGTLFF